MTRHSIPLRRPARRIRDPAVGSFQRGDQEPSPFTALDSLRRTQKLLRRLNVSKQPALAPPTTALGDWYANLFYARPQQYVLRMNECSLLLVIVPARELKTLGQRFRTAAIIIGNNRNNRGQTGFADGVASRSPLLRPHPSFLEHDAPLLHFLLEMSDRLVGRAGDDFHAALAKMRYPAQPDEFRTHSRFAP